jgi:hypothetical protein
MSGNWPLIWGQVITFLAGMLFGYLLCAAQKEKSK